MKKKLLPARILVLLTAFSLFFVITACSETDDSPASTEPTVPTFSVSVEAAQNGTVTPAMTSKITEGTVVPVTVTPNAGYTLDSLSVKAEVEGETGATEEKEIKTTMIEKGLKYTFTMPNGNVTLTSLFTQLKTFHNITAAQEILNGSVSSDKSMATQGTKILLAVSPDSGYELESLSATDASSNALEITDNCFTMPDSDVTVNATFKLSAKSAVPYNIIVGNYEGGTVTLDKTEGIVPGSTVTITTVSNLGYDLKELTVKDSSGTSITCSKFSANKYFFTMPESNVTVTPVFKKLNHSITIDSGIINGTVTCEKSTATQGTNILLVVTPDSGYELRSLSAADAADNALEITGNSFTMPDSDVMVTAVFQETQNQTESYSVQIESAENGSVSANKTSEIMPGSTVIITAAPNQGYEFESLTIKKSSGENITYYKYSTNKYFFEMPNSNVTVTATFKIPETPETPEPEIILIGEKSAPDSVGDIVFEDGSATAYNDKLTLTDKQKKKAVAVIFFTPLNDSMLGVGLRNTNGEEPHEYSWAKEETTGCSTNFSSIVCTPEPRGSKTSEIAYFDGDKDGSDNWSEICKLDSTAQAKMETSYPAFYWANNYAENHGITGDFESGWYMPSIFELAELYREVKTVNKAIAAAGGNTISNSLWYHSSSQCDGANESGTNIWVWNLGASDEYLGQFTKMEKSAVCAIRKF